MKLELTEQQALVLYDWLTRFDEKDAYPVDDRAEEYVLWSLHGQLEKALSQPFRADYRQLVDEARSHIKANFKAGG